MDGFFDLRVEILPWLVPNYIAVSSLTILTQNNPKIVEISLLDGYTIL